MANTINISSVEINVEESQKKDKKLIIILGVIALICGLFFSSILLISGSVSYEKDFRTAVINLENNKLKKFKQGMNIVAIDKKNKLVYGIKSKGSSKYSMLQKRNLQGDLLEQSKILLKPTQYYFRSIDFSVQENTLLILDKQTFNSSEKKEFRQTKENCLFTFDIKTKQLELLYTSRDFNHYEIPNVWALDGTKCLLQIQKGRKNDLIIADFKTKKIYKRIEIGECEKYNSKFKLSKDKSKMLVKFGSENSNINIYNLETGKIIRKITDKSNDFAWSMNSSKIAMLKFDTLRIYSLNEKASIISKSISKNNGLKFSGSKTSCSVQLGKPLKEYELKFRDKNLVNGFYSIDTIDFIGEDKIICFFRNHKKSSITNNMEKFWLQIFDLKTGKFEKKIVIERYGKFCFQKRLLCYKMYVCDNYVFID